MFVLLLKLLNLCFGFKTFKIRIISRIPQGSTLDPLLYIHFINDITYEHLGFVMRNSMFSRLLWKQFLKYLVFKEDGFYSPGIFQWNVEDKTKPLIQRRSLINGGTSIRVVSLRCLGSNRDSCRPTRRPSRRLFRRWIPSMADFVVINGNADTPISPLHSFVIFLIDLSNYLACLGAVKFRHCQEFPRPTTSKYSIFLNINFTKCDSLCIFCVP